MTFPSEAPVPARPLQACGGDIFQRKIVGAQVPDCLAGPSAPIPNSAPAVAKKRRRPGGGGHRRSQRRPRGRRRGPSYGLRRSGGTREEVGAAALHCARPREEKRPGASGPGRPCGRPVFVMPPWPLAAGPAAVKMRRPLGRKGSPPLSRTTGRRWRPADRFRHPRLCQRGHRHQSAAASGRRRHRRLSPRHPGRWWGGAENQFICRRPPRSRSSRSTSGAGRCR